MSAVRLINPASGAPLEQNGDWLEDPSGARFAIVGAIPRICAPSNYADNFGKQWKRFSRTQLDDPVTGRTLSERRFFAESGWNADWLDNLDILEVGSGAGRFSRVVLAADQRATYGPSIIRRRWRPISPKMAP